MIVKATTVMMNSLSMLTLLVEAAIPGRPESTGKWCILGTVFVNDNEDASTLLVARTGMASPRE